LNGASPVVTAPLQPLLETKRATHDPTGKAWPSKDAESITVEIVRSRDTPDLGRSWTVLVDGLQCTKLGSGNECLLPPPFPPQQQISSDTRARSVVFGVRLEHEMLAPLKVELVVEQVVRTGSSKSEKQEASDKSNDGKNGGDGASTSQEQGDAKIQGGALFEDRGPSKSVNTELKRVPLTPYRTKDAAASVAYGPYPFWSTPESLLGIISFDGVKQWEEQLALDNAYNRSLAYKALEDKLVYGFKLLARGASAAAGAKWVAPTMPVAPTPRPASEAPTVNQSKLHVIGRNKLSVVHELVNSLQIILEVLKKSVEFVQNGNELPKADRVTFFGAEKVPEDGPSFDTFRFNSMTTLIEVTRVMLNTLGYKKERLLFETLMTSTPSPYTQLMRSGPVRAVANYTSLKFDVKQTKASISVSPTKTEDETRDQKLERLKGYFRDIKSKEEAASRPKELEFEYSRVNFESRLEASMELRYRIVITEHGAVEPTEFVFVSEERSGLAAQVVYNEIPEKLQELDTVCDDLNTTLLGFKPSSSGAALDWAWAAAKSIGFARRPSAAPVRGVVLWTKYIAVDWLRSAFNKKTYDVENFELRCLELRTAMRNTLPEWGKPEERSGGTANEVKEYNELVREAQEAVEKEYEDARAEETLSGIRANVPGAKVDDNTVLPGGLLRTTQSVGAEASAPQGAEAPVAAEATTAEATAYEPPWATTGLVKEAIDAADKKLPSEYNNTLRFQGDDAKKLADEIELSKKRGEELLATLDKDRENFATFVGELFDPSNEWIVRQLPQILLGDTHVFAKFEAPATTVADPILSSYTRQWLSNRGWEFLISATTTGAILAGLWQLPVVKAGFDVLRYLDINQVVAEWASYYTRATGALSFENVEIVGNLKNYALLMQFVTSIFTPVRFLTSLTMNTVNRFQQASELERTALSEARTQLRKEPLRSTYAHATKTMRQARGTRDSARNFMVVEVLPEDRPRLQFTELFRAGMPELQQSQPVVSAEEWSLFSFPSLLAGLPPSDVNEAVYETEVLRDVDVAAGFSVISGGGLKSNWIFRLAADTAVYDFLTLAALNRFPLRGQHLMASAPQIVAQSCAHAARLIKDVFSHAVLPVGRSDAFWSCMPHGRVALLSMRYFQLPVSLDEKGAPFERGSQLQPFVKMMIAEFCNELTASATRLPEGASFKSVQSTAAFHNQMVDRVLALASDSSRDTVRQALLSHNLPGAGARAPDGDGADFAYQRSLQKYTPSGAETASMTWASRRVDVPMMESSTLARLLGVDTDEPSDVTTALSSLKLNEYAEERSKDAAYMCPVGSKPYRLVDGTIPYDVSSLSAQLVWLDDIVDSTDLLLVREAKDADVRTVHAMSLDEPARFDGYSRHPFVLTVRDAVVYMALAKHNYTTTQRSIVQSDLVLRMQAMAYNADRLMHAMSLSRAVVNEDAKQIVRLVEPESAVALSIALALTPPRDRPSVTIVVESAVSVKSALALLKDVRSRCEGAANVGCRAVSLTELCMAVQS